MTARKPNRTILSVNAILLKELFIIYFATIFIFFIIIKNILGIDNRGF